MRAELIKLISEALCERLDGSMAWVPVPLNFEDAAEHVIEELKKAGFVIRRKPLQVLAVDL